jgi:hypothetical protein
MYIVTLLPEDYKLYSTKSHSRTDPGTLCPSLTEELNQIALTSTIALHVQTMYSDIDVTPDVIMCCVIRVISHVRRR